MLNALIDFSLRQKFIAFSLVILAAFGGIMALVRLPINSLPDVTPVQVLVITPAGRYAPYDVEQLVSFPIETQMNGLPNVKEVRSISQFGLSAVTVEFSEDTDIYFARQMVSQQLQNVVGSLPQGISQPRLGPISTALGEIYQYVVHSDTPCPSEIQVPSTDCHSLTDLRTIQDWMIAPQLKTVPGVTEINAFGGFVKQYAVTVFPEKLQAYDLSLEDLTTAITANNEVSGGNYLDHNQEQYIIRGFGQIRNESDLESILLKEAGTPIFLRDVAAVSLGTQLRQGAVTQDGKGEIVTGIVMMLRGGNGMEVIKQIEGKIQNIQKGLPEGVKIEKFYDQSDLINRTTWTLGKNLLEGGFLVIVVLLLLLGEVRGALIVASVIPLSMLFAFIGMYEFGLAANLMSLGAIDFGMVVDGSVVMIEHMVHKVQHIEEGRSVFSTLREAAHEVARPIFFGVLIIIMVYVPIATFSGTEGILFRPMAITVATAVFGSLLLALVFVPAMAAIIFRKGVRIQQNRVMDWLKPRYTKLLARVLRNPRATMGSALSVFILALIWMPFLGTEFLPELDEGSILVEQVRLPSITLDESISRANVFAAKAKRAIPEIQTIVPKTGRSDLANDWMGVHQTDVWVILKPMDQWRPGITKTDIQDLMRPFLDAEVGLAYNFTQPIAMRVDELTSGVKSDLAVKIQGEHLEELNQIGTQIAKILPDIAGTDNFFLERTIGQPYLNIQIDREAIASFGLNVQDVQAVIEAGLGGKAVSEVFEGQRRFEISLRFPAKARQTFSDIFSTPVPLPRGGSIPLAQVAHFAPQEGAREIARENGWRRVILGINLRDTDIGTYVSRLETAITEKVKLPSGVFLQYAGSFEDQQRATQHLLIVVPLALLLIFGLLYIMFGQARYAWLIFLNLPLAFSGGIFFLGLRGFYLSVSASIGFVALFGVAVLNGIVLVSHLNHLRQQGMNVTDAVRKGAADRLRPVLMTALVAGLGFVPMAFNSGPGSEVQRPLATVVIGGLLTATLLTLFVLPTLYEWIEKDSEIPILEQEPT
ncbi:MAG: efflux RND transporter permease subunit [Rhodothermia bacterium]|nr:efflux RND transporter permease subunit [Rhodothermia bacterium]